MLQNVTDRGVDEAGHKNIYMPNSFPENYRGTTIIHRPPRHQKYVTYDSRLKSFQDYGWPKSMPQKPHQLAQAGFFYEGVSDHVLCFSCDGGLKNWEPNDDPWTEHLTWFEQCPYLNLMRNRRPEPTAPPTTNTSATAVMPSAGASSLQETVAVQSTEVQAPMKLEVVPKSESGSPDSGCFSASDDEPEEETTLDSMKKEVEKLKNEKSCRICWDKESTIVFMPCGHLVTCPRCASAVYKCPVCRTPINNSIKIFKS